MLLLRREAAHDREPSAGLERRISNKDIQIGRGRARASSRAGRAAAPDFLDERLQVFDLERLFQGPNVGAEHAEAFAEGITRTNRDPARRVLRQQSPSQLGARDAGQAHIGDDQVEMPRLAGREGFLAVGAQDDLAAVLRHQLADGFAQQGVVFDVEDAEGRQNRLSVDLRRGQCRRRVGEIK